MINYKFSLEMKKENEKQECYGLAMKLFKNEEDMQRQINLVSKFCQVSTIDHSNLEDYTKMFMNHYFPDIKYIKKKKYNLGATVNSLVKNDLGALATNAISFSGLFLKK